MSEDIFDQKFISISGKVVNCILLSVLWVIFSLPVFTAGASFAALLKSCRSTVLGDEGYAWKTFRESFRAAFKKATLIWTVLLAAEVFLFLDLRLILSLAETDGAWHALTMFCVMIMLFAAAAGIYSFMQALCLDLPVKDILRNAVLLAFSNVGRTFLIFLIFGACAAGCVFFPFLIIILPGAAGILYY